MPRSKNVRSERHRSAQNARSERDGTDENARSERHRPGPPRGVLRPEPIHGHAEHQRLLPRAELAPYIAHFWWVRWDCHAPSTVATLPHPSVHLAFESPAMSAEVLGVHTGRFARKLVGSGRVFGIEFRPAAFQPVLRAPLATLTNRVLPLRHVFGASGEALGRFVRDFKAMVGCPPGAFSAEI